MRKIIHHTGSVGFALALSVYVMLASCSLTKNVPAGDKLYTGASIQVKDSSFPKEIKSELLNSVKPRPNTSLLGLKYRLHIFNLFKKPKKDSGFLYKLKYKAGEPPVLLSEVSSKTSEGKLANRLFDEGWLRPNVTSETIIKGKKASVKYIIQPGTRYVINEVIFPTDSTGIKAVIAASAGKSLLKKNDFISLANIQAETERIELHVKEYGYYYFEPNNLIIRIDSLHNGKADLYVALKDGLNASSLQPWKLGKVEVYSNYRSERDSIIKKQKGEKYKSFYLIDKSQKFKPSVFNKAIMLRQDSLYKRNRHSLTIERLMNLNTFRFVRIAFIQDKDSIVPTLNTKIYLTPAVKQNLRLELSGNSKSSGFVGTDVSLNYRNVNVFRGAEIFDFKITGGFDWQLGGDQLSPNAQLLNAEASLYIPKVYGLKIKPKRNPFIPRTVLTTAIEYLRRPSLYVLRSLKFSAGYNWKEGKSIEHNIKLININSINPSDITPEFESILDQDITLRSSFEKQLIVGSKYQFQYNNTYLTNKRFNIAFFGNLGLSGNLSSLFIKSDGEATGGKKLFNIPISQFTRVEAELRTYWYVKPKWLLASRLNAGAAFGYGNSTTVPYSEQFFIGGNSSLRAFRIRTLGPGSYHTADAVFSANESGEIKIEGNTELRYDMSKYLKLAAFIDAGNIWLRKESPDKPGSGFEKGRFLKEIAVGTGIGFRIDMSVMVLRLDAAFPLRKPWYPDGKRWVLNEIDFGSSDWRSENLIFNIGIGYPF